MTTVSCSANAACESEDPNAECKTNKCGCKTKFVLSDDKEECLLIKGARQVGKTYIIREFGKE